MVSFTVHISSIFQVGSLVVRVGGTHYVLLLDVRSVSVLMRVCALVTVRTCVYVCVHVRGCVCAHTLSLRMRVCTCECSVCEYVQCVRSCVCSVYVRACARRGESLVVCIKQSIVLSDEDKVKTALCLGVSNRRRQSYEAD